MTWQINAVGHVRVEPGTDPEPIERELAAELQRVLSDPRYGCTASTFSGNYTLSTPHTGISRDRPAEPSVHRASDYQPPTGMQVPREEHTA